MVKWIRKSLFAKLFIAVLMAASLLSLAIYGIVMLYLPNSYSRQESARFEASMQQLARLVENRPVKDVQAELNLFAVANKAAVFIIQNNNADAVLAEADFNDFTYNIDENSAISVSSAKSAAGPYSYIFVQELKMQNYEDPVLLYGKLTVDAASDISGTLVGLLPWVAISAVIIAIVCAAVISRNFTRPIRHISAVSKKLAALDLTLRCEVKRSDEVGQLAFGIDRMAENLETTLSELKESNTQLQHAIENQRDFFSSVSHELKTPITVLRGQLESMIYGIGSYKDVKASLPESLEAVNGMQALVAQILTISKLNMVGYDLQITAVNIGTLLEKCIEEYRPLAAAKNIRIQIDITPDIQWKADAIYFPKAVSNVLNNAIRYSPENAAVSITLTPTVLTIRNTGVTLEAPDKAFDAFHREEASGSRETGGSGLGLYMVKTILQRHKMSYCIRNDENSVVFEIKNHAPSGTHNVNTDA